MARVVIANGGMAGIMAAAAFVERGHNVVLIRHNGSEFSRGGLKYLHRTDATEALLASRNVPYSVRDVRGKIVLSDFAVHDYPEYAALVPSDVVELAQRLHWMKTRKTIAGFQETCMNDPSKGKQQALVADIDLLAETILSQVETVNGRITHINHQRRLVETDAGATFGYDVFITNMLPSELDRCLNVVCDDPVVDWPKFRKVAVFRFPANPCAGWDYAYTPWLPVIHRVSVGDGHIDAELSILRGMDDKLDWLELLVRYDLGQLLIHTSLIETFHPVAKMKATMKGHLLPVEKQINYPDGIVPVGRFSCWDSRMTLDKVYERSISVARNI